MSNIFNLHLADYQSLAFSVVVFFIYFIFFSGRDGFRDLIVAVIFFFFFFAVVFKGEELFDSTCMETGGKGFLF